MRINPKEKLFDQPVLKVREVVRYAMAERLYAANKALLAESVATILKQPRTTAKRIVDLLVEENYLELKKVKYSNGVRYELRETEQGRRFGIATANAPITRNKAELLLKELIERSKTINANDELVYFVERLSVFGSYLTSKEVLSDVDVFYKLSRRQGADWFSHQQEKRIKLALMAGRTFNTIIEQYTWPCREVYLMLSTKKKGLSLHNEESDEIFHRVESRIVFEADMHNVKGLQ